MLQKMSANKSPENILTFQHHFTFLVIHGGEINKQTEKPNLNRAKFGSYVRPMKEIGKRLMLAHCFPLISEGKVVVFFVSCSWVSYCLSFLPLSKVYELVFASAWRTETEKVIWVGRHVTGIKEGKSSWVKRRCVPCKCWWLWPEFLADFSLVSLVSWDQCPAAWNLIDVSTESTDKILAQKDVTLDT